MAEVREMTRNAAICARSPIRASVIPSTKYSCAGSPERFCSGRTTIDVMGGVTEVRDFRMEVTYTSTARSDTAITTTPTQFLLNDRVRTCGALNSDAASGVS